MDKNNIMQGMSASPEDWDEDDDKAVRGALFDFAERDGHYGSPETWLLYDQIAPLLIERRVEAKRIALETGKSLSGIWNTLKKRPTQERSEVIDGSINISDHHQRRWREAWAIAAQLVAGDDERSRDERLKGEPSKAEMAKEIFLQHSDQRTVDAWEAMNYEQLSLFDDVFDDGKGEPKKRFEVIVDETPTGHDPAQLNFLDAVLDEAGLSERVKDVAEHLSDGTHPAEIARELGVSKQTVMRDMRVLKRFATGWINDVPWPSTDIGPDDEPDDEPQEGAADNGSETSAA